MAKTNARERKIQEHILRLVKVASRGGNYLLNIGPKGDGSVVEYEAEVLRGTGKWLRRHSEAIYGTDPQPFRKLDFGYATVKGGSLYLFVEKRPADGRLRLPGLQSQIREAHWLNSEDSGRLATQESAGGEAVVVPAFTGDDFLPVIKLEFDGAINVQPTVTEQGREGTIRLLVGDAERFFNNNGEGYYDPPTIRGLRWDFGVKSAGRYRVEVSYRPGPFSRVVDIKFGGKTLKANLYGRQGGREAQPAVAGKIDLEPSADLTLSIVPSSPAERGAKLDLEITGVSLIQLDAGRN